MPARRWTPAWPTASAGAWPPPAGPSTTTAPRRRTGTTPWRCWLAGRSSGPGVRRDDESADPGARRSGHRRRPRAPRWHRRRRLRADRQRRRPDGRGGPAHRQPAARPARPARPARGQERVRAGRVRILLRAGGRRAGVRLPRAGRGRRGLRDHHRRGTDPARRRARRRRPRRRHPHRRAAGDHRGGRRSVRLLHAGVRRRHPRPARPGARSRPARRARGAGRQPVPLHRLRPHPGRGRAGGDRAGERSVTMSVGSSSTDVQAPPARGGSAGGHVGDSPIRPDGTPKVQGRFAFASDLEAEGMLWGRTLRSPHPYARVRSIDVGPALAIAGVSSVVTADDVPGASTYGLISPDQPVFARDVVRYVGEAVAAVAADHPDTARRALSAIVVDYEPLDPLVDPARATAAETPVIHPDGNVIRHIGIQHGDPAATGDVVVEGVYEVGMQDQAFLGPESGLAAPDREGGVDLWVATQWLHEDRDQVAACLGLAPDDVRLHLGGVGGAFGGREDVSMQIHACLLALRTGHPVKMTYLRDESFVGHVHRHPARMRYRHHATAAGDLVKVEAEITLDGGAYASSSSAVVANAARFACGPYRVPSAVVDATVVRTNNPPCGAMRGFGAVQACFGHESQMDKLAARLGIDPVELRLRNALCPGDVLPTGQSVTGTAPVAECIRAAAAHPLPPPAGEGLLERPGGAGRTDDRGRTRRGVGFAVGFKNLLYSEGFDDTSEARVRLAGGVATVTCAVAEVGQGFVTIAQQIVRTALGCDT